MKRTFLIMALGVLVLASNAMAGALVELNMLRSAAQQGDRHAMYEVGRALLTGEFRGHEIGRNPSEAFGYLNEMTNRSRMSDANAPADVWFMLGECYERGDGTGRDLGAARNHYRQAADMGYGPARDALDRVERQLNPPQQGGYDGGQVFGSSTINMTGPVEPPRHHDAGVDRLVRAAEQGRPDAQFQLGMAFLNGEHGLPSDPTQAFHWVHEAAERGYGQAERELSNMYMQGIGVRHSRGEAIHWDHRARAQGF